MMSPAMLFSPFSRAFWFVIDLLYPEQSPKNQVAQLDCLADYPWKTLNGVITDLIVLLSHTEIEDLVVIRNQRRYLESHLTASSNSDCEVMMEMAIQYHFLPDLDKLLVRGAISKEHHAKLVNGYYQLAQLLD